MIPAFLTRLDAEKVPSPPRKWWQVWSEPDVWVLTKPLRYASPIFGGVIEVPAGTRTDFASVPRVPLAYLVAGNTAHESATVHDFLYGVHLRPRKIADKILYEAMGPTNVLEWRRRIIYRMVRLFGGSSYRSGPKRYKKFGNS